MSTNILQASNGARVKKGKEKAQNCSAIGLSHFIDDFF